MRSPSKRRAIRNALSRAGLQAGAAEVVEALAQFGVRVSPALVNRVRVELLQSVGLAQHQRARLPCPSRRPVLHSFQKKPRGHSRRG